LAEEKVFHYKQGGGTNHYLHWENLYNLQGTGIMQQLMPMEEEIYQRAKPLLDKWYKQGKVDTRELEGLYGRIGSYLKDKGVIE
jgi:hypothetical protein